MDDETGFSGMDVAAAANALRAALNLPAERFPAARALSMLGDELTQWRARGFSDEAFAATVAEATGLTLPPGLFTRA